MAAIDQRAPASLQERRCARRHDHREPLDARAARVARQRGEDQVIDAEVGRGLGHVEPQRLDAAPHHLYLAAVNSADAQHLRHEIAPRLLISVA